MTVAVPKILENQTEKLKCFYLVPIVFDHRLGTFYPLGRDSSDDSNQEVQSAAAPTVAAAAAAADEDELEALLNFDIDRAIQDWDEKFCPELNYESLSLSIFICEMQLSRSNRLLIPVQSAANYFPYLAPAAHDGEPHASVEILQLTDGEYHHWYFPVKYYDEERAFMITRGWPEFLDRYKLQPLDVIRFYEPAQRMYPNHFLIEFEKKRSGIDLDWIQPGGIPEFRTENFLFMLELSPGDVGSKRRLLIPMEQVTNHFPGVQIPESSDDEEILRFTDAQNKDWYMNITRRDSKDYVVRDGWGEYLKEQCLDAEKVIKFYKPVQPSHAKHFLIDCVKKEEDGDKGRGD